MQRPSELLLRSCGSRSIFTTLCRSSARHYWCLPVVRPAKCPSPGNLRALRTTAVTYGTLEDLEKAKQKISTLTKDPGNNFKLKLYSLYKQVRVIIVLVVLYEVGY